MVSCSTLVSEVSGPVYILVILFSWAAWIDINGLFVETPLMVGVLPEGWNVPSYLTIIIQIANIGPLIYTIAKRSAPGKVKQWPAIYIVCGIGVTSCMLLAFFWQRTSYIGGELHSTALFILTGFLALVDCTSSVAFLPYMANFKPQYITAYYIGEGLSGLLPGLVGLIQGVGSDPDCINTTQIITNETTQENITTYQIIPVYHPPRFEVRDFFFFLAAMIIVSAIAFSVLHFAPFCQKEKITSAQSYELDDIDDTSNGRDMMKFRDPDQTNQLTDISNPQIFHTEITSSKVTLTRTGSEEKLEITSPKLPTSHYIFVLILTGWVNAIINGVLPATQSYSCLPYGYLAYTLAVRLATVANPLMSLFALFVGTRSILTVGLIALFGTGVTCYHLYLSIISPFPPLKHDTAGIVLTILTQVFLAGSFAYVKVNNAAIVNDHGGQTGLLWYGGVTQIGSCIGAVITFCVVNFANVFQSEQDCAVY